MLNETAMHISLSSLKSPPLLLSAGNTPGVTTESQSLWVIDEKAEKALLLYLTCRLGLTFKGLVKLSLVWLSG